MMTSKVLGSPVQHPTLGKGKSASFAVKSFSFIFSGVVFMYIQLQLWIWLFFHILSLFWGVKFPFHYRSYQQSGRVKYVHVATVVIGILVPLIPAFLPFALNGYGYSIRVPPVFCVPIDISLFVYPVALPVGLLSMFSTVLFLIVFRSISKVIVIKNSILKCLHTNYLYISVVYHLLMFGGL